MAANNFSPLLGTRGPPTSGASPALSSPHPDCTTQNIATTPRTLSSVYRISPACPRAPYPRPSRRPWRAAVETARATLRQGRPAPLAPPWATVAATEAPARGKGGQRAERRRPRHGRAQAKALSRGQGGPAAPEETHCPGRAAPSWLPRAEQADRATGGEVAPPSGKAVDVPGRRCDRAVLPRAQAARVEPGVDHRDRASAPPRKASRTATARARAHPQARAAADRRQASVMSRRR